MKYYKAMNKDFSCRGFQYEIGGIYELPKDTVLVLGLNGFHFCDILANCFNYYSKSRCVICEVEPLGNVIHDEHNNILVTDKIKIIRQLSNEEIEKEQYIIQDGIEMVGFSAFYDCTNLKEINIPNSVTYINYCAFCLCKSLEKITISNSVTYIDTYAFYNCTSLKSISIHNAFTYIGENTFYGCENLEKIYVPKNFDINVFNTHRINGKIKLLDKVEIVRIEKERK